MPTPRPTRSGFTLIELLVVVAIIALLAALLLPSLKAARLQAKGAVCLNNLKQLGVLVGMYADDYNGYAPTVGSASGCPWYGLIGKPIGVTCTSYGTLRGMNLSCPLTLNDPGFTINYPYFGVSYAICDGSVTQWQEYYGVGSNGYYSVRMDGPFTMFPSWSGPGRPLLCERSDLAFSPCTGGPINGSYPSCHDQYALLNAHVPGCLGSGGNNWLYFDLHAELKIGHPVDPSFLAGWPSF